MKEINLDARAWRNRDDFYGALLPSLGAPHWHGRNLDALNDSLAALHILGIEVPKAPTKRDQDMMFEQVKDDILAIGFDEILAIPRATDPRTDLAVAVLNDAGV